MPEKEGGTANSFRKGDRVEYKNAKGLQYGVVIDVKKRVLVLTDESCGTDSVISPPTTFRHSKKPLPKHMKEALSRKWTVGDRVECDYKVPVIAVDELHVSRVLNKRIADSGDELKLDDAVKIVGCWNGLGKHVAAEDGMDVSVDPQPMRTAIAFAQSIKHSKLLTAEFERISDDLGDQIDYLPALEAKHVDGTMNVVERNQKLSWLKDNIGKEEPLCRILSNARCLSEGVDVPALDAAIFLNRCYFTYQP